MVTIKERGGVRETRTQGVSRAGREAGARSEERLVGLSEQQVRQARSTHGSNALTKRKRFNKHMKTQNKSSCVYVVCRIWRT